MPKALVCIPTYNEIENIEKIIPKILSMDDEIEVLIIDDNSPDGTGDKVEEMMRENKRIHLIKRPGKMGLGTAYVEGFKYAIKNNFDLVFEMDADFSHDPNTIPSFLEAIKDNDLVLGSRYINGINVLNWPMKRLLLSYFANVYTKIVTGMKINDATGGFKCFRIEVLKSIDLDKIKSNGYSFQIEMTFKAWKKGFRIKEIPIIFMDRQQGTSKMNKKIIHEAIFMVWKLRFRSLFKKL
ncbi:MAG TPA: polyprenol monophosphomannose synthase [Bacteroidota bacterium]|jgi:dolichol-phosphate mannosyltransferase|nr:polyprenol monophosphomannose synthase [Bacteroidota bacterium]